MSQDLYVTLNRSDLPSAQAWASTVRSLGLSAELDTSLSPATATGYWPCPDSGAGFEFSVGPLDAAEVENLGVSSRHRQRVRSYDSMAVLSFKTDADFVAAQSAAAALASVCKGLVIEGESAAVLTADQAVAWAKGGYEPPREHRRPAFLPQRKTSVYTWVRLGVLALLAGYWLYRWASGR